MSYLLLVLGLLILVVSGEVLVKGAVQIAYKFKLSPLVVGMTIVSFGTSAPELLVSLKAALDGHPDIAIGNVIGSNISNLALVLGLTAIIFPITVSRNAIKFDWPAMMAAALLLFLFILDGDLVLYEGILFLISLFVFIWWRVKVAQKDEEESIEEKFTGTMFKHVSFIIVGCLGLAFGATWFLDGAVGIAQSFGISERIIGLTIVAFGTSVPELVTSCVAAFRKQTDISVGNLIGSNLLNVALILGITSCVKGIEVSSQIINSDIYWMLGISLAVLPILYFGKKVSRIRGVVLFFTYITYIYLLI